MCDASTHTMSWQWAGFGGEQMHLTICKSARRSAPITDATAKHRLNFARNITNYLQIALWL